MFSIIDLYVTCGATVLRKSIMIHEMENSEFVLLETWNRMICGYFKSFGIECSVDTFSRMPART